MKQYVTSNENSDHVSIPQSIGPFRWPLLPLLGIALILGLGVFILVYEVKHTALTRHIIKADITRQAMSGKVTEDTLQCRRFEKDVFLSVGQPEQLKDFLNKWHSAWERLAEDTETLGAQLAATEDVHCQKQLNDAVLQYYRDFLFVVEQIQSGQILTPGQANLAMMPYKSNILKVSRLTSQFAEKTFAHIARSGEELVWRSRITFAVSLLMTVTPGLILLILSRGYNQKLRAANQHLQTSNAELKQSEEQERLARSQAVQAKIEIEQAFAKIESQRRELKQSDLQFKTLVNNIPGVTFRCHFDDERTIEFISNKVEDLIGYPADDFIQNQARDFVSIIYPEDLYKVREALLVAVKEGKSYHVGYRVMRQNRQIRFVLEQGQISKDSTGALMVDGVIIDVTEHKKSEIELRKSKEVYERASLLDKLTGLPNRTLFHDRLTQLIQKSRNRDGAKKSNYAVIYLDFDRFKMVNDSLGHDIGDMLLIEIASRLRSQLRCTDSVSRQVAGHTAGRLGGDEFIILLDGINNADEVVTVAERLLIDFARPYNLKNHEVYSTASMGIVIGSKHYKSAKDVIRDADTAMYEAKRTGRSRYVIFDDSMRKRVIREMMLENDLRKAVEYNQLELYYQPIVSLKTGAVRSVEALIRWNHPKHGIISPGEFIPIAEDTQQIIELGEWVLREGCRQYADWSKRLKLKTPSMISINLSRKQFACPLLVHTVERTLQEFKIEPKHIQLEVTEDAFASDIKSAIQAMKELKEIGVKLAIDDFGIGRSSFASLNQFPVDTLKIDRSLISEVKRTKGVAAMINSLVVLSENLGIMLIPEGIEEESQVTALVELGCDFGQGYFFGRPMPAGQLEEYLLQQPSLSLKTIPQMA